MIGHVIVCRGRDENGEDSFAVWQVSTEGVNTGAWAVPVRAVTTDPVAAHRLVQCCVQRSVTAWDPSGMLSLVATLENAARMPARNWADSSVALPDLLTEIAEIRSEFDKRIVEEQQRGKNFLPLEWDIDVPDPVPTSTEEFEKVVRLARLNSAPVIREALLLSSQLRWCVQRWQATLAILRRRDQLRSTVDQLGVLPPRCAGRLAAARGV